MNRSRYTSDRAAAWNAWRAEHHEVPDLSRAGLRGLDLTGFDLSRADIRGADLRGTKLCDADLSGARLEGANFFKALLDGADLELTQGKRRQICPGPCPKILGGDFLTGDFPQIRIHLG